MGTQSHFDTIVIGSGFGGATAAAVLAEGGRRVCVLERGRAYPPGSFPRSPKDMSGNFWDPSEGYHGLFQLWSFRHTDAVVSSGLGGGSLIYANVMLRKPEDSYVRWDWRAGREVEGWPIRPEALREAYDWVEQRIGVTRMPEAREQGYSAVRRTDALQRAGARVGEAGLRLRFDRPPLAVSFGVPGGRPQPGAHLPPRPDAVHTKLSGEPTYRSACLLCGECDIGCNSGSKNSLDHTLLSDASAAGADIRPLHEVTGLRRLPGDGATTGWEVTARDRGGLTAGPHEPGERFPGEEVRLTADRVVLAAGTYGSTYLLLRLRRQGLAVSEALGRCVSGNGDFITWVTGAADRLDGDRGPVITMLLESEESRAGGARRVSYVEDGGYPSLLAWLGETLSPASGLRLLRFVGRRWVAAVRRDPNKGLARDVASLIGTSRSTSTLPLLGIGMDVADGTLHLRPSNQSRLELRRGPGGRSDAYYERVTATMAQLAGVLGGKLIESPWWALRRSITVHPLGGCPMGVDGVDGVVDEWGEVFGQPGLYVMDGSVMPGPIGANPALTIAAFAARASRRLLA